MAAIIWTTSFIALGAAVGAQIGWANHGLVGAIALGVVGAIGGGCVSRPDILLQILT